LRCVNMAECQIYPSFIIHNDHVNNTIPGGIILLSHNPILLTEVNNIVWIIVCIINTFNNTAGPRGPARTARRLELLIVGSGRGSSFSSFPYFHGIGVRTAGHLQRRCLSTSRARPWNWS